MAHTWRDAFSDYTQFSRGRKFIGDLDSTPVTAFATTTIVKITHIHLSASNGSTRKITFRPVGGGTAIMTVVVGLGRSLTFPGWQTDELGVEVLTDSGTNDTQVTLWTVEPTIA